MIAIGQTAPALAGPTDEGDLDLRAFAGKPVIVYFYPKDMTPGCTTEARDFRDLAEDFEAAGAVVIGVSKDSIARHGKFRAKECLPFALVSDESGDICERWGVWQTKKLYGREYLGIVRATFLVGADGRVARVWPKVKVNGHAVEVLEAVRGLAQGG